MSITITQDDKVMGSMIKHATRESWLYAALNDYIRPHFEAAGFETPVSIRIGVGWPSKNALSKNKRRVGEAWSPACSNDGAHEIIISPFLSDADELLHILIHEVAHTVVGVEHQHKKPFIECAKAVGLVKPWTATTASDELAGTLDQWQRELGVYPHSRLDTRAVEKSRKKQSTRMIKVECENCGFIMRTTSKWIDRYAGAFPCPCGETMKVNPASE